MRHICAGLAFACFASGLLAQTAPVLNQNGLILHNAQAWTRRIEFPNFRATGGNVAGDCLWKVIPATVLMTGGGTLHLTGFETALEDLEGTTALNHPDLHIYDTRTVAGTGEVPDFTKPLARFAFGSISLPTPAAGGATGVWLVNWSLGRKVALPTSTPSVDRPLALALMAEAGENLAGADGTAFPLSALENYAAAPQKSFSGWFNAARSTVGLADGTWDVGDPAGPFPAGEAWLEPAFYEPIIQPWSTAAVTGAGVTPHADLGPGAVWSDLARGSGPTGTLGWRIESWQDAAATDTVWAFLLLNTARPTVSFQLAGMSGAMAMDLRDPNLALVLNQVGSRQVHKPTGFGAEFWDGVYATTLIAFPRNTAFLGTDIHVGAVMVNLTRLELTGSTNTCAVRLR